MNTAQRTTRRRLIPVSLAMAVGLTVALVGCRAAAGGGAEPAAGGDIVVGATLPLSGPLAVYGAMAGGLEACFNATNDAGGIDGRQIRFEVVDDAYDPRRAVSNAREFVENDNAFAVITFGAPALTVAPISTNLEALHIGIAGSAPLDDIEANPFTRAWNTNNEVEGRLMAERVIAEFPDAKIGTLTQADAGDDYVIGVREAIEEQSSATLVLETQYAAGATSLSQQVNELRSAGVDVVISLATGAAPIQMVQYIDQIGWDPLVTINESSAGIAATISQMGPAADGIWSLQFAKDPADGQWDDDAGMTEYRDVVEEFGGDADASLRDTVKGFGLCTAFVATLESVEGDLTAESFLAAWDGMKPTPNEILWNGLEMFGTDGESARLINQFIPATFDFDESSWVQDGEPMVASY